MSASSFGRSPRSRAVKVMPRRVVNLNCGEEEPSEFATVVLVNQVGADDEGSPAAGSKRRRHCVNGTDGADREGAAQRLRTDITDKWDRLLERVEATQVEDQSGENQDEFVQKAKRKMKILGVSEESIEMERNTVENFLRFTVHTTSLVTRKNPKFREITQGLKKHLHKLWKLWLKGLINKRGIMYETLRYFNNCSDEAHRADLMGLFTRWHFNGWHARAKSRIHNCSPSNGLNDIFK